MKGGIKGSHRIIGSNLSYDYSYRATNFFFDALMLEEPTTPQFVASALAAEGNIDVRD
jgi:hypothetical protein